MILKLCLISQVCLILITLHYAKSGHSCGHTARYLCREGVLLLYFALTNLPHSSIYQHLLNVYLIFSIISSLSKLQDKFKFAATSI